MRRYWGTLAGLLLGIAGGFFGALFGAFLGFLVDLIAVEFRAQRFTRRYLETGEAPRWLPVAVPLCGHLYGRLARHAAAAGVDVVPRLAERLRAFFPDSLARRAVERMLVAAIDTEWIGRERWVQLASSELSEEAARVVFQALWDGLQWSGSAASAREEARALAHDAGVGEQWIREHLADRELLHPEACAVLGVSRDAGAQEIRRAYRLLVAQFHPDTTQALGERERIASEEAFKRIQAAYEKLRIQRGL